MLSSKALSASSLHAFRRAVAIQHPTRAFSITAPRRDEETSAKAAEPVVAASDKNQERTQNNNTNSDRRRPQRPQRYNRSESSEGAKADSTPGSENSARRFNRPKRRGNKPFGNRSSASMAPPKFEAQPVIPYETVKELQFVDQVDWEVSSVFASRPLYSNIASGKGTTAPLGTINNNSNVHNNIVEASIPGPAFSAHMTGVRVYGDLDPETEQSLIQELSTLSGEKDHRKKSDVSLGNQNFSFHMTHNFQEILNPRNRINRFNNGNVKHVAGVKYEAGSDEMEGAVDQQAERSWKRLERIGGDYSRSISPLSQIKAPKTGQDGTQLLASVSQIIGMNQSIGSEDKKKFLKAVERGLGGY